MANRKKNNRNNVQRGRQPDNDVPAHGGLAPAANDLVPAPNGQVVAQEHRGQRGANQHQGNRRPSNRNVAIAPQMYHQSFPMQLNVYGRRGLLPTPHFPLKPCRCPTCNPSLYRNKPYQKWSEIAFNQYTGGAEYPWMKCCFETNSFVNVGKAPDHGLGPYLECIRMKRYQAEDDLAALQEQRASNEPSTSSASLSPSRSASTSLKDNSIVVKITDSLTGEQNYVITTDEHLQHHLQHNCAICKTQETIRVGELLAPNMASLALLRFGASNLFGFTKVSQDGHLGFATRAMLMNGLLNQECFCEAHQLTKLCVLTSRGCFEVRGFLCPLIRKGYLEHRRDDLRKPIHHPAKPDSYLYEGFQELFPDQDEVDLFVDRDTYNELNAVDKSTWPHPLVSPSSEPICELMARSRNILPEMSRQIADEQSKNANATAILNVLLATENLSLRNRQLVEKYLGVRITTEAEYEERQRAIQEAEVFDERSLELFSRDSSDASDEMAAEEAEETVTVLESNTNTSGSPAPSSENELDQEATSVVRKDSDSIVVALELAELPNLTLGNAAEVPAMPANAIGSESSVRKFAWKPVEPYSPPETITVFTSSQQPSTSEETRRKWKHEKKDEGSAMKRKDKKKKEKMEALALVNFKLN